MEKQFRLFAVVAGILIINFPVCRASWWDNDWRYRRELTFSNSAISEDLINFPVLVALTSSNFVFSTAQTNGADIRFIDADDTTVLKHEIEKWEESGTNAWIWVNVPKIDAGSSDDFVYIYYGNPGASDGQDATNVWNDGYVGVWHLQEASLDGSTGEVKDSTGKNNDGTGVPVNGGYNGPAPYAGGRIDGALSFYATNAYIEMPDAPSLKGMAALTLELWFKCTVVAVTGYEGLLFKRSAYYLALGGSQRPFFEISTTATNISLGQGAFLTTGNWHHCVVTYDGTNAAECVDGSYTRQAPGSNSVKNTTYKLHLGRNSSREDQYFGGTLDEVRISAVARSTNWIKATYLSGTDSYLTYGAEELAPPPAGTVMSIH